MKTRIVRYLNSKKYKSDWMIEIKSKNGRYYPLFNGDEPYYFKEKVEAEEYLESVKDHLIEIVNR